MTETQNTNDTLATRGQSKMTAENVLAIRTLKAANPDWSARAVREALGLAMSNLVVDRTIRGIYHSHLDMCGLEPRPMGVKLDREPKAATKKKAAKKVKQFSFEVAKTKTGGLAFTPDQVAEVKRLATEVKESRGHIAMMFGVSVASIQRVLAGKK